MPRFKKYQIEQENSNSININQYITIDINNDHNKSNQNQNQQQDKSNTPKKQQKVNKKSTKKNNKKNQSNKKNKQNFSEQQTTFQQQNMKNNSYVQLQQDQKENNKIKKARSVSKRKPKNSKKIKENQNELNQDQNQKINQQNQSNQYKRNQQQQKLSNQKQQQDKSQSEDCESKINFNNRRKNKQKQKLNLDVILSKYTEQQDSLFIDQKNSINNRQKLNKRQTQSDIQQFQLLVKKKQKKNKKQVKVKNKYFSDISITIDKQQYQNQNYQDNGQQIPQNDQELIFDRKQPIKKIQNLNKIIQQRVEFLKGRREFKNVETDLKYKNHLKKKLQQVKDAQQIQIDVQVPNVFTKKTTSAALFMKNKIQKEQKNSQIQKTFSHQSISLDQTTNLNKQINKNDIPSNKNIELPKNKKKGVRRQDFFNHLVKQIKTKRQTNLSSQQIKDCFKTSSLQQANEQFEQDIFSNEDSNTHQNHKSMFLERRVSVDSNQSKKSQKSIKSNNSNSNNLKDQNNLSNSRGKSPLMDSNTNRRTKPFIEQNINKQQTNINKNIQVNTFSISEQLSNQLSSKLNSLTSINKQHRLEIQKQLENSLKFNTVQIKQQVIKSFSKNNKNIPEKNEIKSGFPVKKNQSIKKVIESLNQQEQKQIVSKLKHIQQDIKLEKKKKQKKSQKNKKQKQKNQKGQKKQKTKKKKKKSTKQFGLDSYFQTQAGYSSSQQGHSEEDQDIDQIDSQDLDENGNIIDLVDENEYIPQKNDRKLIMMKFLQDQKKQDQKIIQQIMKGIYGRKKYQPTQSQKQMQQRMRLAALKNQKEDQSQSNQDHLQKAPDQQQNFKSVQQSQKLQIDQNQDIDSKQNRKLQSLQEQLIYGGFRPLQHQQSSSGAFNKNFQNWLIIKPHSLAPEQKLKINPRLSKQLTKKKLFSDKKSQPTKIIINRKSNKQDQQKVILRKSLDKKVLQKQQNKNKLQKTSTIQLNLGNKNMKGQDIQI